MRLLSTSLLLFLFLVSPAFASYKCLLKVWTVSHHIFIVQALNAATIEAREEIHDSFTQQDLPFVKTEV